VGGEEFAVLWSGVPDASALHTLAEGLRRTVEVTEFVFEKTIIPTTVSLGIALRRPTEGGQALYKRADERLYEAKAAGRNCVR
jgi:diguanylate cyclase (GGDEF)-like protein